MQRSPHANSRQEREKTHAKKPTCKVKGTYTAKGKEMVCFVVEMMKQVCANAKGI